MSASRAVPAASSNKKRIPICEPSPVDNIEPRLPRVGDRFQSWDDFRTWSRRAAEVRGFTLSQSQSKGSSGTIVLRCSRFKDPGTVGQKMAENGCGVVFKVMKAKNGLEGFEVVNAFDEHNHPFGPDLPIGHRPGTLLSGQAPKRKKVNPPASTSASESALLTGTHNSPEVSNNDTPPTMSTKPFLFDPYTGKPLRSSTTPMPTASTPSPPTQLYPIHQVTNQPGQPAAAPPLARASSSASGTPRSHSSRGGNRTANYSHPASIVSQQPESYSGVVPPAVKHITSTHAPLVKRTPDNSGNQLKNYPPLSIRLSLKAQNSITEFLTSLSPALTSYGTHFKWVGIQSPSDLLDLVETGGEEELELFLDEIDTCGTGGRGEGVSEDEKSLIIRGVRKLSSIKNKS